MAGAIRNQFNLVGNTVNNGTTGGVEGGASGGGSTGADSATVQAAVAKAAMDAGTTWSVKLTNGETMTYRIIGINHDDLADGGGKAGLTFEATNAVLGARLNPTDTNTGGWEKSELRGRFNSGDLWTLLPAELQSKVKSVTKMTDNKGGGSAGTPTATTDKVFLLSATEVESDGVQYEYYKSKGVTSSNYSGVSLGFNRWTRSVCSGQVTYFHFVDSLGDCYGSIGPSTYSRVVLPAFCF